jgi:hypothetical protein
MPQCPPNSRPPLAEQKALLVAMKREREHVDPGRCQGAHVNLEAAKEEFYDAEASSAPAGDEEDYILFYYLEAFHAWKTSKYY